MTSDPQAANADLVRARAEVHAAQARVNAAQERLDAVLAAHGWRRMSGLLGNEPLYVNAAGEAFPLNFVLGLGAAA